MDFKDFDETDLEGAQSALEAGAAADALQRFAVTGLQSAITGDNRRWKRLCRFSRKRHTGIKIARGARRRIEQVIDQLLAGDTLNKKDLEYLRSWMSVLARYMAEAKKVPSGAQVARKPITRRNRTRIPSVSL